MIPNLVEIGSIWKVLPPGIHEATLEEVKSFFALNSRRNVLYKRFIRACKALKAAGCSTVYLDGSYVTSKPIPNDYDVCWDTTNVEPGKIDPVFLDLTGKRESQKLKYGGEFFPSSKQADGSNTFLDYFQIDKETGKKKGIICILLTNRKLR